ncbi:unnamed protein product, partial [Polarella glacialis]
RMQSRRAWLLLLVLAVSTSELSKLAWSRWLNDGYGYWWVTLSGFSVGNGGSGGVLLEASSSLIVVLVVVDLFFEAIARSCSLGERASNPLLGITVLAICTLCVVDLSLHVGAGGARVSLPLVLFALSESGYVWHMVRPWIGIVVVCALASLASVLLLAPAFLRCLRKLAPKRRTPLLVKLALAAVCSRFLWVQMQTSEGVGPDMLSQLGADALALLRGSLLPTPLRAALESHRSERAVVSSSPRIFPPVLLFHWEAGKDTLLSKTNASATPYLRRLVERPDVVAGSATVSMPITLKSAWE